MLNLLLYRFFGYIPQSKIAIDYTPKNPSRTIIFFHGIAANSSTWLKTIAAIKKDPKLANSRLIALDLLGFGKSPKPKYLPYTYQIYQKSLVRTLKKLKITTPLFLVGHSMGALIVADLTSSNAISPQQLFLISPPVILPKDTAGLTDKFYIKSYKTIKNPKKIPGFSTLGPFFQKISNFRVKDAASPAFPKTMENIILNPQNFQTFTKLKVPATIIHGNLDPLVLKNNLKSAVSKNPKYLNLISCLSPHEVSPNKIKKLQIALRKAINEPQQ